MTGRVVTNPLGLTGFALFPRFRREDEPGELEREETVEGGRNARNGRSKMSSVRGDSGQKLVSD